MRASIAVALIVVPLVACDAGPPAPGGEGWESKASDIVLGTDTAAVVGLAGKCLDFDSANLTPSGNPRVVLRTCSGVSSQLWRKTRSSQLINASSGRCMNAENGGTANSTNVVTYPCSATPLSNERWFMTKYNGSNNLQWEIVGAGSNRCANVQGGNSADRTPVILWDCVGGSNDTWSVRQTAPLVGLVGKCIDVDTVNKSSAGNARAILRACNGSSNQNWTYRNKQLVNSGTGRCLNVENGATANGSGLVAYTCSTTPLSNEKWTPSAVAGTNGISYELLGVGSGRCVNVPNASRADGMQLVIYDCAGVPNDTWSFQTQFLFRIKVRAYAASNDNGTNATAMTVTQFRAVLDDMNTVFGRAGIALSIDDADWIKRKSTYLNTIGGAATTQQDMIARGLEAPGYVIVIIKDGGAGFSGYSSPTDYVALPDNVTSDLALHELGHYFGLGHTMTEALYKAGEDANVTAYKYWSDHGQTIEAFNTDLVGDTPPDPGPWVFERRWGLLQIPPTSDPIKIGYKSCDGTETINITAPNGTVAVTVTPDRHNAMSYFKHCWIGSKQTFSALQLSRINGTLYDSKRSHLVRQ